jgi:hypothetical protein
MSEQTSVLGPIDPEAAVLTHLHTPQWQRGLKLARTLVRTSRTDEQVIGYLEASCPGELAIPRDWWRSCLAELARYIQAKAGVATEGGE